MNKEVTIDIENPKDNDLISRQAVIDKIFRSRKNFNNEFDQGFFADKIRSLLSVKPQEQKTDKYEYHIDHTDCIWYGNDSGCPVTCSQYRDGWNDAMDYIFKNGNGYQPYRHDD